LKSSRPYKSNPLQFELFSPQKSLQNLPSLRPKLKFLGK
jgi:hypothetical protein